MTESPDDIVGHKTFDTGETDPETGFPKLRHEPLTRAEASALADRIGKLLKPPIARMPDEQSAIRAMCDAYTRLKELGWGDPAYCPKDGSHFQVIEAGSTGIHDCSYHGEWPTGSWWVYDGDVWPSRPTMFKRYPKEQAEYEARWKAAGERFRAARAAGEFDAPAEAERESGIATDCIQDRGVEP